MESPAASGHLQPDSGRPTDRQAPFGREAELERLRGALARVRAGQPGGGLWLFGPAGIGKTRILEAFEVDLADAPVVTVGGVCPEHRRAPYAPFTGVLQALLPLWRAECADVLARRGPALAGLMPAMGLASLEPLAPASERLRLQSAIVELATALANKRGLVWIFEDAQWADMLSEELLAALLRAAGEAPLLVIVSSRELLHPDAPWASRVERVALGGLDRQAIGSLLAASLDDPPEVPRDLLDRVAVESAGNPRRVLQCLARLKDAGDLVRDGEQWVVRAVPPAVIPPDPAARLAAGLQRLSAGARDLAHVAAVLGGVFERDAWQIASGLSDESFAACLEAMEGAGIAERQGARTYRLAEASWAESLLAALTPEARQACHRAALRALEPRLEAPLAEAPLDLVTAIAEHAVAAAETVRAIDYTLEAGVRHAALFSNDTAERLLAAGLALANGNGATAPRVRLKFLRHLGDVHRVAGRNRLAAEAYDAAFPLLDAEREPELAIQLWTSRAQVHQGLDELAAAAGCCDRALALDPDERAPGALARCLMTSARLSFYRGEVAESRSQLARALTLAKAAGDRARAAEALAFLGYMHVASPNGRVWEGIDYLHEAVAILNDLGDKAGLVLSHMVLGNAQLALGDFVPAERSFTIALWICQEVGNRTEEGIALLNMATCALELGSLGEACRLAQEALANARTLDQRFQLAMARALLATAHAHRGHLAEAREYLDGSLAIARTLDNRYLEALLWPHAIEVCLLLGDLEGARLAAADLEALMLATGHQEGEARLHALLAEVAEREGAIEEAKDLATRALELADAAHAKGDRLRALKVKARVARRTGDAEALREFASEGLGLALRNGARLQRAELEGLLGAAATATGRPEAFARFEAMAELGREVGSPCLEALGLAGQAGANSDPVQAAEQWQAARGILSGLGVGLSEVEARRFAADEERRRVIDGVMISS